MSRTLANSVAAFCGLVSLPLNRYRRLAVRALAAEALTTVVPVRTAHGELRFVTANRRALEYPAHFHEDEPETLAWIDAMPPGAVFWDIGANVGIFSLYAGLRGGIRVLAFEPSSASYDSLVRNVYANRLGERVLPYNLAFSDRTGLDMLYMKTPDAGASQHAFGEAVNAQGDDLADGFRQPALGFSVDDFVRLFDPPLPTHVKLDVDSIEDRILAGAAGLLAGSSVVSLMVEVEGEADAPRTKRIVGLLADHGFAAQKPFRDFCRNTEFRREV
jgi:FkbM family methyltransferase